MGLDLRDVTFNNVESFFGELELAIQLPEDRRPACVRIEVDVDDTMDGVTKYAVRAGFTQDGFLRELVLDCGEDYVGCDPAAKQRAAKVAERIARFVRDLGVRVAGGTYRSS